MNKRTWHYLFPPQAFDMRCDKCWNNDLDSNTGLNITWSEWEHLIWCFDCEIDTEGFKGIFGGPVPINASYMLGLTFDRWNMEINEVELYNLETSGWDTVDIAAKNLLENKDYYGQEITNLGKETFECSLYELSDMIRRATLGEARKKS